MKRVYPHEEYCLGCRLCEVYCKAEHSPSKDVRRLLKEPTFELVSVGFADESSIPGDTSFALQCRHCREPACVEACPTGAMDLHESGIVLVNEEKCVGCWMCAMACPFGAVRCRMDTHLALKCDLCPDREMPACVANCPSAALVYKEPDEAAYLWEEEPQGEPVIIDG